MKTWVILFKIQRKTNVSKLNLKLCGQKLHPAESAKYLGVIINENLNWKKNVIDILHKLIQCNAIVTKSRNYVSKMYWFNL